MDRDVALKNLDIAERLLVNRFGYEGDVVNHIRLAIEALKTGSDQGSEASTGTPPTPPIETVGTAPAALTPAKTPATKTPVGRRK